MVDNAVVEILLDIIKEISKTDVLDSELSTDIIVGRGESVDSVVEIEIGRERDRSLVNELVISEVGRSTLKVTDVLTVTET